MAGGFFAGAGDQAAEEADSYTHNQAQTAMLLKLQSAKLEQEHQNRVSEIGAGESAQEEEASHASVLAQKQFLFNQANQPKVAVQDITALKAMLGPRMTPEQGIALDQLVGQPVQKLDALSQAADRFKIGSGQIIPLRDSNGVHIADRFSAPNGDPHDLPIAGAAEKSQEAGRIVQYQNYMHQLVGLHDRISGFDPDTHEPLKDANGNPIKQFATTGPSSFSLLNSGQMGASALKLQGALGYNDLVSQFNKVHDSMLLLASKGLEQAPNRSNQMLLDLSKNGNINLDTKNSVMHDVADTYNQVTATDLGELRRLATTSDGLPAPTQVPVQAPQAPGTHIITQNDIQAERQRRAALKGK